MKKREVKWKALLASILFHLLLAFSVSGSLPYAEDPSDAVEVSLTLIDEDDATQDDEAPQPKISKLNGLKSISSGKRKISLKQPIKLFPGLNLSGANLAPSEADKTYTDGIESKFAFQDARLYDTDISEIFGESGNENWAHFKEVYSKVDSNLNFDSILAQYNHFGRVYVQFELDESGILKTENLKVASRDSILKVHVLRAIKKSFSEPRALLNTAKGDKGILYQARFDFNFGNYRQNFSKQNEFGRPVFSFRRYTEEKPVPEELLEQLLTGGVSPNISSMYERWQKYNQKKRRKATDFDPFSSYKNDPFYSL